MNYTIVRATGYQIKLKVGNLLVKVREWPSCCGATLIHTLDTDMHEIEDVSDSLKRLNGVLTNYHYWYDTLMNEEYETEDEELLCDLLSRSKLVFIDAVGGEYGHRHPSLYRMAEENPGWKEIGHDVYNPKSGNEIVLFERNNEE